MSKRNHPCIDCGIIIYSGNKRCRKCYEYSRHNDNEYKNISVNGKCVREHRYIMECILGRKLKTSEFVHHINGDIRDNRPENLQLMTHGEHTIHHMTGRRNTEITRKQMSESAKKARSKDKKPRYPKNPKTTSKKHSDYKKKWWDNKRKSGEINPEELSNRMKKVRAGIRNPS